MLTKMIKTVLLTLLTYLLQISVSPLIPVFDIAPNIALAVIAVVSVALGMKYTVLMSFVIGYFLEITLPAVNYVNLLLYPISAILCAMMFADKSERAIAEYRARQKQLKQLNPHLRTVLCAAASITFFELILLLYTNLNGVTLTFDRFVNAFISIVYTTVLAAVLQFPIRWLFRVRKRKTVRKL